MTTTVSYSPSLGLSPQPGDLVVMSISQSNDAFWGPYARTAVAPNCFFFNVRDDRTPAQWTLNQGRDTLDNPHFLIPGDTQQYFPPLGAGEYRGGSSWSRFFNHFESTPPASRPASRVIVIMIAEHGAPSGQFTPSSGGVVRPNWERMIAAYDKITSYGWDVNWINYAQGESDALGLVSPAVYKSNIHKIVDGLRDHGVTAPFIIDQNTLCRLRSDAPGSAVYDAPNFDSLGSDLWTRTTHLRSEQAIREAQLESIDPARNMHQGIDCDLVHGRLDGCHHSRDGHTLIAYLRYRRLFEHIANGVITV